MYFYTVTYTHDYKPYPATTVVLTHEKQYTSDEVKEMVDKSMAKTLQILNARDIGTYMIRDFGFQNLPIFEGVSVY
jgi:hypothetical protein